MNIQRICFLGTRTRNFDGTASFFRDVLGLNLGHAEPGWSVFSTAVGSQHARHLAEPEVFWHCKKTG